MARILADEHIPVGIVFALRRLGHDVLTVRAVGLSKSGDAMPDDLVLQFASQQRRIIFTFNERDFRRLHGENAKHAGILCSQDPGTTNEKKFARHMDAFLKQTTMNSQLEVPP
ncbi:MAG TPA: DUF5615 family PIN-like protein, partial [Pirellulales bacterium]|nr:DUF5615 family PIN-like protein [Pirellulales bacterium]